MSDYKSLIIRILYWSGVLLLVRTIWIGYVLIKVFPVACLLLASMLGMAILYE